MAADRPNEAKNKGEPARKVLQANMKADRLLSSLHNLVSENVIDISGASGFYKKRAEVATLLQNFVEPRPNFHYRLKNGFDCYFLANFPLFMKGNLLSPSDALADALFVFGRQWARIDYGNLPIASIPSDEFLRHQWSEADNWAAFLVSDACIGEAWWHNLSPEGKVRTWSGGSDPRDFELRVDFGFDTEKPPTIAIRIKGEPAAIFMKWWMTLSPNSPAQKDPELKALREQAVTVLDSIVGRLKMNLKLIQPEKGRPSVDFGERAAYLLDHKKQNLPLIAKELCHMPQGSSSSQRRQCFDRIRKAANNYYKLLRSDYTTLTPVRVRARLFRIPGNPNPSRP